MKPFVFPLRVWALLTATALTLTVLSACGDKPAEESAKPKAVTPVTMAAIEEGATGLAAGATMSARTVYVFFDAQCPHCGALWQAAKPLKAQARFV